MRSLSEIIKVNDDAANAELVHDAVEAELAKTATKYYFVEVEGVEAFTYGPYINASFRDICAKMCRNKNDDTMVFWMDMVNDVPITGEYSNGFMEG